MPYGRVVQSGEEVDIGVPAPVVRSHTLQRLRFKKQGMFKHERVDGLGSGARSTGIIRRPGRRLLGPSASSQRVNIVNKGTAVVQSLKSAQNSGNFGGNRRWKD